MIYTIKYLIGNGHFEEVRREIYKLGFGTLIGIFLALPKIGNGSK